MEAALAYAMIGDIQRAQVLADELNKRYPLDTQMQSLWLPAIKAQRALTARIVEKPSINCSARCHSLSTA